MYDPSFRKRIERFVSNVNTSIQIKGKNRLINTVIEEPEELVPDDPEIIWSFPTPPSSRTITGFSVRTDPSGTILVDWGDNTSNTINSGSFVNKTY